VHKCAAAVDCAQKPTHALGNAISKPLKTHYSYSIQIIRSFVRWNPLQNGDKTHNFFVLSS
jgi:hypothetical protein